MSGDGISMREAIRDVLAEALRDDPRVVLLGEDIGEYGGAFGVTRGLEEEFGVERVRQTPISENGFVGCAVGAAAGGLVPIVEIMFSDFLTCCADALVNHAAKYRYMYDGLLSVPLVVRTPMGRRFGYGATHSQSPEALFLGVPGLKIVAPADPIDAGVLLRAAIRDPDPVLFFEHKLLYDVRVPRDGAASSARLGEARIVRPGRDVTLISHARGVRLSLEAAEELSTRGVEAEVVDLRTVSPLDVETCAASVRRTGRLVCVSEDPYTAGVASHVAASVTEAAFEYLRGPVERVTAADVPVPSGPELEEEVMVEPKDIVERASTLVRSY